MCPIVLLHKMSAETKFNLESTVPTQDSFAQETSAVAQSDDEGGDDLPDLIPKTLKKSHIMQQRSPANNKEDAELLQTPLRKKIVISRSDGDTRILLVQEESNSPSPASSKQVRWEDEDHGAKGSTDVKSNNSIDYYELSSLNSESSEDEIPNSFSMNNELLPSDSESFEDKIPDSSRNKGPKRKRKVTSSTDESALLTDGGENSRLASKDCRPIRKERYRASLEEDEDQVEGISSTEDDDDDDGIPDLRSPSRRNRCRSKKCTTCNKEFANWVGV